MMHLGWVSPLPPLRSGIADYSAELAPALASLLPLTLFAPSPWESSFFPSLAIYPLEALPEQAAHLDGFLYHMGNNPYHADIYRLALRFPGIVVLHDYILHHLVARCTLEAGDTAGYLYHLAYARGRAGLSLAVRRSNGIFDEREQFLEPLNDLLLERSLGAIVHSRWAAEQIRRDHPDLPVAVVPHYLSPHPLPDREEARCRLGLSPDEVMVASFGFIAPEKRVDLLLWAYARLREEFPRVRCFLVGEPAPSLDLTGLLFRLGLEEVVVTGYVDMARFYDLIAACDIAVSLRYPSAGETSGALIRLLGNGKAVVLSNMRQFAEWPDDVCLKVDPGPSAGPMLLYYLRRLAADEGLRRRLGENARRYVAEQCALARSAQGYLDFIAGLIGPGSFPHRAPRGQCPSSTTAEAERWRGASPMA